jgi:hypothetical protein
MGVFVSSGSKSSQLSLGISNPLGFAKKGQNSGKGEIERGLELEDWKTEQKVACAAVWILVLVHRLCGETCWKETLGAREGFAESLEGERTGR